MKKLRNIIVILVSAITGTVAGVITAVFYNKKEMKWKRLLDKNRELVELMNQWLKIKQEGKSITTYFHRNAIRSIAIYGMSYVGERLYEELRDLNVEVRYGIDKKESGIYFDIDVLKPQAELPEVDAIIVTAVSDFKEIRDMLAQNVDYKIISLEDILFEL